VKKTQSAKKRKNKSAYKTGWAAISKTRYSYFQGFKDEEKFAFMEKNCGEIFIKSFENINKEQARIGEFEEFKNLIEGDKHKRMD